MPLVDWQTYRCKGYTPSGHLAVSTLVVRMSLSPTGRSFPRCDKHWNDALVRDEEIRNRYPYHQPADFDPSYAGEAWGEDDY